jgi:hypothetical protein
VCKFRTEAEFKNYHFESLFYGLKKTRAGRPLHQRGRAHWRPHFSALRWLRAVCRMKLMKSAVRALNTSGAGRAEKLGKVAVVQRLRLAEFVPGEGLTRQPAVQIDTRRHRDELALVL